MHIQVRNWINTVLEAHPQVLRMSLCNVCAGPQMGMMVPIKGTGWAFDL